MGSVVVKYALVITLFIAVIGGTYYSGYSAGSDNTRVEYVTQKIVEYVEVDKKKSDIYAASNADRDTLLKLYTSNKF